MKTSILTLISTFLVLTSSCNNAEKTTGRGTDTIASEADKAETRQCYVAVDKQDTAYLNLRIDSGGKAVFGDLVMQYAQKPKNDGTIKGEFRGDTLFADYTFTTGKSKTLNRNPLAFLKEGSKLTLGVGIIETYLGRSYLAKDKPINFDKGRFKFNLGECK